MTLRVSDRDVSERFYRTVLAPLGIEPTGDDGEFLQFRDLSIAPARDDRPLTTGLHVGLVAANVDAIQAFWDAGVAAGFASDGEPGPRPAYSPGYHGAFLLDPDGNSIEACLHEGLREGRAIVDHLWIRVVSAQAAADFYGELAPVAGFSLRARQPGLVRYRGARGGSVTFIEGEQPTSPVHFAFPVPDEATVGEFHATGLVAGGVDHGPPGLRPEYDSEYYGAFLLDPHGHNVEAVTRSRGR